MATEIRIQTIHIRAYSIKEIRELYGITPDIWREWIRPYRKMLGIHSQKLLNANQVRFIFEKFGIPGQVALDFKKPPHAA